MKKKATKKKPITEKKTGDTYPSKKAMMKHEKSESKKESKSEYKKMMRKGGEKC